MAGCAPVLYLFDRCLEMGNDTALIDTSLIGASGVSGSSVAASKLDELKK